MKQPLINTNFMGSAGTRCELFYLYTVTLGTFSYQFFSEFLVLEFSDFHYNKEAEDKFSGYVWEIYSTQ